MHPKTNLVAISSLLLLPSQAWALVARATSSEITVLHRWSALQGIRATSAFDQNGNLIGSACSATLDKDAFANYPISFSFEDGTTSSGEITVGDLKSPIALNQAGGKPSCIRAYNSKLVELVCTIPVSSSLKTSPMQPPKSCFQTGSDLAAVDLSKGEMLILPSLKPVEKPTSHVEAKSKLAVRDLKERQGSTPACTGGRTTGLVGDGNPHQNYLNKQITETIDCGSATCTATYTEGTTLSFSFSAGFSVYGWINGGFAVEESFSTERGYECQAQPGQSVCVWYNMAHTAYTVQNFDTSCCNGVCSSEPADQGIIYSPNTNNVGGDYYCVVDTCRSLGEQYWNYDGRAGGP